eukprot:403340443
MHFNPGTNNIDCQQAKIQQATPGSCHLVAQMITPCLLFQQAESIDLTIRGGSIVGMSPTTHSYQQILIPQLRKMGINIDYEIESQGIFPDIVGQINLKINKQQEKIKSIQLLERGKLQSIDIYMDSTIGLLQTYYKDEFQPKVIQKLEELLVDQGVSIKFVESNSPINIPKGSKSQVLLVTAVLNYQNDTCIQAHALIEKSNFRKTNHVEDFLKDLKQEMSNQLVTMDEYHTDQMLIFMALAEGTSAIICQEYSLHTQTRLMGLDFKFEIIKTIIKLILIIIKSMSEKILNEFAVRLNKSRTQLSEVCNQVENLKNEAQKLQKELDQANLEKIQAERLQDELKHKYINTKVLNEEESERHQQEQNELNNLRKLKRKLVKDKELSEKDCEKLSNELQQHIHDRKELESLAKRLSEQLDQVQTEKQGLLDEYTRNQHTINDYNGELKELKGELESMKNVIAHTFEDELKTANSILPGGSLMGSKMSKRFQ